MLVAALAFIAGILLDFLGQLAVLAVFIIGLFFLSQFRRYRYLAVFLVFALFAVLGMLRSQASSLFPGEFAEFLDKEITFAAKVIENPDKRQNNIQLVLQPEFARRGRVQVLTDRFSDFKYGDTLYISGVLKTPEPFDDFNYKEHLAAKGIYAVMRYPKIEFIEQGGFSILGTVFRFKDRLQGVLYSSISFPQSTLLGAMILGDKRLLSDETKERLNRAGVRHITAVSGMHVVVLSGVLMSLFLGLGLWRYQSFLLTVILISLFIILTGLQASAIRAGIMGGMFLLGHVIHRQSISQRALIMAAAFMLFLNPKLLTHDIGFQLSFLAVFGIILFLPVLQRMLRAVPNALGARDILGMTFAAQLFTLPLLIHNFGYVSLISPLTNLLLVPFIPVLLSLGFLFLIAGVLLPPLGFLLSFPISLLLLYFTGVIDAVSAFPLSTVSFRLPLIWIAPFYALLLFLWWKFKRTRRFPHAGDLIQ